MKKVAIVIGAAADWQYAKAAADILKRFKVPFSVNAISFYRTPARTLEFSGRASQDGFGVIIAVSGPTAHLAASMAASTVLPVIAVPLYTDTQSATESYINYAQTPRGVPIATVGVAACENAALLAIQILAIGDPKLTNEMAIFRQSMTDALVEEDFLLQQELEQM